MGYTTLYSLDLSKDADDAVAFLEYAELREKPFTELRKRIPDVGAHAEKMEALLAKLGNVELGLIHDVWMDRAGEMKWYDHESDMRTLSKLFPDVVFTLRGDGEESSDIWVKYFKAGKMQRAVGKITFDEFDAAKLK